MDTEERKEYADVVIAGTGVAGLYSALNLPRDKKIIMITKSDVESSDSFLAQGGICVLRNEEDYGSYFEDTMRAGHYENRKESVDIMIRSSQSVIRDLIGYGVEFQRAMSDPPAGSGREAEQDTEKEGLLKGYAFTREGAHSRPRILFHEDVTGKEITSRLLARVRGLDNVEIREYTAMTDIIVSNGRCRGIIAEETERDAEREAAGQDHAGQPSARKRIRIYAKDTILATGGIGGRYEHSTNFPHLTGDALTIAEKHGIRLEHLDYV